MGDNSTHLMGAFVKNEPAEWKASMDADRALAWKAHQHAGLLALQHVSSEYAPRHQN